MRKKELALIVIERLKKEYPYSDCTLDYDQAWKLLVSVRLAAQCTDARVNEIVPLLYEKFPTISALADADVADITLTSVKIDEVVTKAVESVGEDATSVTAVEILVNASTESEGEVQSITYEVRPEAIVTVSKQGEADTTSTVELSNADLAADAEFTFELDVSD